MDNEKKQLIGRRELLRKLLRQAALGGLGYLSLCLLAHRPNRTREEKCINPSICRNCDRLPDCLLPRALSVKQFLEKS